MEKIRFEVCANSLQSALAAQKGGADRIELCSQLKVGGVTPSAATIKMTIERLRIPVFILIRPRSGDFFYDDFDMSVMKEDIEIAKKYGAAGVVFGVLLADGNIDVKRTSELVKVARPMQVNFHRAFDRARSPLSALEDVIKTGADRILTSGQAKSASSGKTLLKSLVEKASDRIIIIAASGITPENVSELINSTGVREVHASCSVKQKSEMEWGTEIDTGKITTVTDAKVVSKLANVLINYPDAI